MSASKVFRDANDKFQSTGENPHTAFDLVCTSSLFFGTDQVRSRCLQNQRQGYAMSIGCCAVNVLFHAGFDFQITCRMLWSAALMFLRALFCLFGAGDVWC